MKLSPTMRYVEDADPVNTYTTSDGYVREVEAEIRHEDEAGVEQVGRCMFSIIPLNLIDDCEYGVAFDTSQELMDAANAVWDWSKDEWNNKVADLSGGFASHIENFILIEKIEVLPPFRGHGAGLIMLDDLITRYGGGFSLVLIKPFPLQFQPINIEDAGWRAAMGFDEFTKKEKQATKNLTNYYRSAGFKPVGKEHLALHTEMRRPSAREALKQWKKTKGI
jgi:GNAT superfamily N-acetyltransferase